MFDLFFKIIKFKKVAGDGSCLSRSLAVLLDSNESQHAAFRQETCVSVQG